MMKKNFLNWTFVLLALGQATAALGFSVSPLFTTIDLAKSPSTNLTVKNDTDKPIKLQVEVYQRLQNAHGHFTDVPTKALAAFPNVLALEPRSTRQLRASLLPSKDPLAQQNFYKVLVRELPQPRATTAPSEQPKKDAIAATVDVVRAFHIAVYIHPEHTTVDFLLPSVQIRENKLLTLIQNAGNFTAYLENLDAFVQINGQWIKADPKATAKSFAIVTGNTVSLEWECPSCVGQKVTAVQIKGNVMGFGEIALEGKIAPATAPATSAASLRAPAAQLTPTVPAAVPTAPTPPAAKPTPAGAKQKGKS